VIDLNEVKVTPRDQQVLEAAGSGAAATKKILAS
jgi:hypothetical protein